MAVTGALVKKSVDQTAADYDPAVIVTWDAEVYDTNAFHDTVTDNTRLTVPASANGSYVVVRATLTITSITASSIAYLKLLKNGVTFVGWGGETRTIGVSVGADGTTKHFIQASSAPILVATNDYFEVEHYNSDASVTIEAESSSFGILVLGNQFTQGCLAKKAADQTTADYDPSAVVAWDGTDVYDTDAAHDPASSNSKIIVPSAWNGKYGILTANIQASAITSDSVVSLAIQRGGSDAYDGFGGESKRMGGFTTVYIQCETQPILLTTADEFEARLYSSDASITVEEEYSTFGLWIVG